MSVISQFHSCNSLLQIWRRAFAHYLNPPGEHYRVDRKQNYHTPELNAPVLSKLSLYVFGTGI